MAGTSSSHRHEADHSTGFYNWFHDVIASSTGVPVAVLVTVLVAFSSEAISAFYNRVRDRPLFWLRSRCVSLILHNILSSLLHGLRLALMFTLMLIFMTLDPWLCFAVLVGGVIGHLVCQWSFSWQSEIPDKEGCLRSQW
ncbi:copper transport protein CTR2 isoform X2 [Aplysia californica]|nr:copper transport protein CTR2 isoform X2 [Aplysia californica]XP_012943831.1 copper transport protein CTR2 isoform X2 [Aplysia californica]